MPSITPNILILETEYLIAMDAERILTDALNCQVTIATPANLEALVQEHAPENSKEPSFTLALLSINEATDSLLDNLKTLLPPTCRLAFTTTNELLANGVPGFEDCPVLLKPYGEQELVSLVKARIETTAD